MQLRCKTENPLKTMTDELASFWKTKRNRILEEVIRQSIADNDRTKIFTNHIGSQLKTSLEEVPIREQEVLLFDDVVRICKGLNAPHIQCEFDENEDFMWIINPTADDRIAKTVEKALKTITLYYKIDDITRRLRADKTCGPCVYTVCSVVRKYLRTKVLPALLEGQRKEIRNMMTLKRITHDLDIFLHPLYEIVNEIEKYGHVGGCLITYLQNQLDRGGLNDFVQHVLDNIISLVLRRYYGILFEWLTQCTLTSDLAREFFIWDLSNLKGVTRNEFSKRDFDGTAFDYRFVIVDELCPERLTSVKDEIVRIGKYLYTMQLQKATSARLLHYRSIREEDYKNKSMKEIRDTVRQTCEEVSCHILHHLTERFDVTNLVLRMPYYFLSMNSTWIEDLAVLIASPKYVSLLGDFEEDRLQLLYDNALDRSNLRNDEFRSLFRYLRNTEAFWLHLILALSCQEGPEIR
jgi:bacterioferritin-associated ferredoxin